MTRILFGQSYYLRFDPKLYQAMQPYPPLGTLWAAAYVRERGHEAHLFDAMLADSEERWADSIAQHRPHVAVIFEDNFNYLSKMCLSRMRDASFRMLATARQAGATTIVCGSDATDNADRYLEEGADFVIIGEGEVTLGELLDSLDGRSGTRPAEVIGVATRGTDGDVISTGRRANLQDLDALPMPAWDLVDVDRYRRAWARHGRFSLNVATTRGCPFHCNWCAKPIWGQRYAVRSAERVADEVAHLRQAYGPGHISFVDDIFGLRPGWTAAYAAAASVRGAITPFKALSRADLLLRDGEVEGLRAAGAETIWMGAESGAQSVLDAMDKGTRIDQIVEARRRLGAAGIRSAFFLQFGYPGEGPTEIAATRQLVRDTMPDDIGISVSYPLPGTGFFERVRADLGERRNWVTSDDLAMMYRGPYSTAFYRRLHGVVHREFRLRRAAGTVAPTAHLARLARRPWSRERLAQARDAIVRPLGEALLRQAQRREDRKRLSVRGIGAPT